jgi:hypothetical protein
VAGFLKNKNTKQKERVNKNLLNEYNEKLINFKDEI